MNENKCAKIAYQIFVLKETTLNGIIFGKKLNEK